MSISIKAGIIVAGVLGPSEISRIIVAATAMMAEEANQSRLRFEAGVDALGLEVENMMTLLRDPGNSDPLKAVDCCRSVLEKMKDLIVSISGGMDYSVSDPSDDLPF